MKNRKRMSCLAAFAFSVTLATTFLPTCALGAEAAGIRKSDRSALECQNATGPVLEVYGLHGAKGGKDDTRFSCRLSGGRLYFRFSVRDATPCAPPVRNAPERTLEDLDRVEVFLSPRADMSQRYCCIELGLAGDVLDYAAMFPRKMEYGLKLKTLKVDTRSDGALHTVSASVALEELAEFGIDPNKMHLGVFRADYEPGAKLADWYSATPHGPGEADFHRPCQLFEASFGNP